MRTTTSGEAGTYTVPELAVGLYAVTVSMEGFQSMTVGGVEVTVAGEHRVDVTLQPGRVESRVVVEASAPMVTTTEDTLGGTVQASQVANLPVNGRDYTKLIYMQPGVTGSPDQITDSPGGWGEFSVNGARGRANNFLLDGTDMNDGYRNDPAINQGGVYAAPSTILPVDAVAELAVLSNFAPEYGRNAGGVINIVTKSGTNELHGTAAEYFRNDALDARNFFNNAPNPKTSFHNNQFGASLGGPIVKNKTFFFADYDGQREVGGLNNLDCAPTASEISAASVGITVNPVIAKLLAMHPWPTPNINTSGCPNVSATVPIFNNIDSVIGKIDHNFNQNHILTGRYYFGNSGQSFPLALVGGGVLPGYNTYTPTRVQLVSLSQVTVLSSTQVNEIRAGFNRFAEGFYSQDRTFNPSSIGLNTGVGAGEYGLPVINVSDQNYGTFGQLGASSADPRSRVDQNWQLVDNFSWKRDRHEWKFGYEFRRTTVSQILDRGYRGALDFTSLSDFLAGTLDGGSQLEGDSNRNTVQNSHGLFAQDSFRATRRLVLNYGVRWDYFGVISEKHGLFSNYPVKGLLQMVGASGLPRLYNRDLNNFAPRASIVYDLTGKGTTVIRTGFGVFYDAFSQDFFIGHIPYNSNNPGVAYNPIGPDPILSGSADPGPLNASTPVFSGFGASSDLFAADQHLRTPYMYNFNFNLQQEFSKNTALQIGYIGSIGHKLFRFRDINQPVNPTLAPDVTPNANYGPIDYEETSSNSNYNALQTSLRLHGMKGFQSTINYTWSHSLDNASDGEDFMPNVAQPNNSYRPNLEYGNSSFDVRHRFVWMWSYDLPKWSGHLQKLTDGWGVNSVFTYQTGQPFGVNIFGDYDGSGEAFPRLDVVGNPYAGTHTPDSFVNLSAFRVPCTLSTQVAGQTLSPSSTTIPCNLGTQHFGDEGRDSLFGPGFLQFDFAVYKNTQINERVSAQFRAEVYNLPNHPNFCNPLLPNYFAPADYNGINPNTGRGQGFLPITATADVGIGNPFLGGGGPRGIQLALKFTF
jgi:outer membrane receptor protein involved in Fe transport